MMIWELHAAHYEAGTITAEEHARQLEPSRKATRRRTGFLRWRRARAKWERLNERFGARPQGEQRR
jgi:hypothetical protein